MAYQYRIEILDPPEDPRTDEGDNAAFCQQLQDRTAEGYDVVAFAGINAGGGTLLRRWVDDPPVE